MNKFYRGQAIGCDDLFVTVRDIKGNLIDPYKIYYAIYNDKNLPIGALENTPEKIKTGQFFVKYTIPISADNGKWYVRWTLQETIEDPIYHSNDEFEVVEPEDLVNSLRDKERKLLLTCYKNTDQYQQAHNEFIDSIINIIRTPNCDEIKNKLDELKNDPSIFDFLNIKKN